MLTATRPRTGSASRDWSSMDTDEVVATPQAPPGLPRSLDYPRVSVGAILRGAAGRWPDRVGWIDGERQMTFGEAFARASQFAHALRARGVGRGDVVAVHSPNCIEYPVVYYGILLAGATFSPTNPLLPPDDLAFQLADCNARAVVTWSPVADAIKGVRDRIPAEQVVTIGGDFEDFLAGHPTVPPAVEIDVDNDLAHIAYTGGTTGRSKGVELPYRNVIVNTLQFSCWGSGSMPRVDDNGGLFLEQI